jgi:hypothetical protein
MAGLVPMKSLTKLVVHAKAPAIGPPKTIQPSRTNAPVSIKTEDQNKAFREQVIKDFMKITNQSQEVAEEWTRYFPGSSALGLNGFYTQLREVLQGQDSDARARIVFATRTQSTGEQADQFIEYYGDFNMAVLKFIENNGVLSTNERTTRIKDIEDFMNQAIPPALKKTAKQYLDSYGSVADAIAQYLIDPTIFDEVPIQINVTRPPLTDLQNFIQLTDASEEVAEKFLNNYENVVLAVEAYYANPNLFVEDVVVKTEEIPEERLQAFMHATGEIDEEAAKTFLQYFNGRDEAAIEVYNIKPSSPSFVKFMSKQEDAKMRDVFEFQVRTGVNNQAKIKYYLDDFGQKGNGIEDAIIGFDIYPGAYKQYKEERGGVEEEDEGPLQLQEGDITEERVLAFQEATGEQNLKTVLEFLNDFGGRDEAAIEVWKLNPAFVHDNGGKPKSKRNLQEFLLRTETYNEWQAISYLRMYAVEGEHIDYAVATYKGITELEHKRATQIEDEAATTEEEDESEPDTSDMVSRSTAFQERTGEEDTEITFDFLLDFKGRDDAAYEVWTKNRLFVQEIANKSRAERNEAEFMIRTGIEDGDGWSQAGYYLRVYSERGKKVEAAIEAWQEGPDEYKVVKEADDMAVDEVWEEATITAEMEPKMTKFQELTGEWSPDTTREWLKDFEGRIYAAALVRRRDPYFLTQYGQFSGKTKHARNVAEFLLRTHTDVPGPKNLSVKYRTAQAASS